MIKKVVFMGTPDFAVGTLKALIDSEKYQVQAVFTQPDKPKGRSGALQMTPVKSVAVSADIPVYQPVKIREPEWLEVLRTLQPDVIVVVAFGQIIPKAILELPPYGCINVHASLLPKYRGAAPIQWAVINGEKESGVTTMRMDEGLDTGDMILKEIVPLAPEETGSSLFDKLSQVGARLLIRTLDQLDEGTAQFEKQPAISPTAYASMLTKKDGRIDFTRSAREIECLIRGLDPWPGTWTIFRGKHLKIWKAAVVEPDGQKDSDADIDACDVSENAPGTVCAVTKNALLVQTGSGVLSILEVQPEGKKRMSIDAFLRGYPVQEGDVF
ncbi:MAG: methionyl-tRNA formyltransferase [Lachnospiraceae bacterium]|nr:methionyl-tRNA formyltransferase [Lachnospiraceae bacterium]